MLAEEAQMERFLVAEVRVRLEDKGGYWEAVHESRNLDGAYAVRRRSSSTISAIRSARRTNASLS